ncbi:helix-turn-helix transcriptional regulator [Roseinatronobacter sp.]
MLDPEDSALLLKLGDVASHGSDWADFLGEFATLFQTDAALLFVPPQVWGWDRTGTRRTDPMPMPLLFAGLRAGRVYSGEELRDRALAQDMKWLGTDNRAVGLRLAHGPACLVLRRDKLAFRAADTARLAAFAPHIAQALDQWHVMQAVVLKLNRLNDISRRVGVGGVALDVVSAVILDVDQTAASLLLENGLDARAVLDRARLHTAPAVVALGPGLEMLLLAEEARAGQVMAYLRQTDAALPDAARIAAALGISRAEARLARALGEGASLNAAAARLGLTVETARNYSKRIYARSGLRGQAALVRYLWCSALLLAR